MNAVLLFHRFQANIKIGERYLKGAFHRFHSIQAFLQKTGDKLDILGAISAMSRRQPAKVSKAGIAGALQFHQLIIRHAVSQREIAVEQILGRRKLAVAKDGESFETLAFQTLDKEPRVVWFIIKNFLDNGQVDIRHLLEGVLEVSQRREKQPFYTQAVCSQLQADQFAVALLAHFICDPHLSDGVSGSKNGCYARYQGLIIVDEFAPAASLSFCYPEKREKYYDNKSNAAQKLQPPLLRLIHSFCPQALKTFTSHFRHPLKRQAMGVGS